LPAPLPADAAEIIGQGDSVAPPTSSTPSSMSSGEPTIPVIPDFREGSIPWRVRGMIRTVRPNQWVKNFFVLAPIVFAKELTSPKLLAEAGAAFAVFCLLAGAVYTLNDIVDVAADRVHPVKRRRPIASGRVPIPVAKGMVAGLLLLAFGGAALLP